MGTLRKNNILFEMQKQLSKKMFSNKQYFGK